MFHLVSLSDPSNNYQRRDSSGYFPSWLMGLGVRLLTLLSHTFLLAQMNIFFFPPCTSPAVKHSCGDLHQKAHWIALAGIFGFLTCLNYPSKACCSEEVTAVPAPNCYPVFSKFSLVPTVPPPSTRLWKRISNARLDSTANWRWQPWDVRHACYPFTFFSCSPFSPLFILSPACSPFSCHSQSIFFQFLLCLSLLSFLCSFFPPKVKDSFFDATMTAELSLAAVCQLCSASSHISPNFSKLFPEFKSSNSIQSHKSYA